MIALSEHERDIVAKNHNLIYGYANKHNLDIEEFYGILAIGLCKAAKMYNNNKDDIKVTFSTIAYKCMRHETINHFISESAKKRIPSEMCVSLYQQTGNDCQELIDLVYENTDITDDIIVNADISFVLKKLTEKEQEIINALLKGVTWREITKMYSVTTPVINNLRKRMQRLLVDYNT